MTAVLNAPIKPVLVFGYGNLSRGDDALGPLLLELIRDAVPEAQVDILSDFQLQVEHALDLQHRALVLFADAAVGLAGAFNFIRLEPCKDNSYTSHAVSPAAILEVYGQIFKQPPPPCFLLTIQGSSFNLGDEICHSAANNLAKAGRFVQDLLRNPELSAWSQHSYQMLANAHPTQVPADRVMLNKAASAKITPHA